MIWNHRGNVTNTRGIHHQISLWTIQQHQSLKRHLLNEKALVRYRCIRGCGDQSCVETYVDPPAKVSNLRQLWLWRYVVGGLGNSDTACRECSDSEEKTKFMSDVCSYRLQTVKVFRVLRYCLSVRHECLHPPVRPRQALLVDVPTLISSLFIYNNK